MGSDELIKKLLAEIEAAVENFNSNIPDIQQLVFNKVAKLLKGLDTNNGRLVNSVANLKEISSLQKDLQKIVLNPQYQDSVSEFLQAYNVITKLNNDYFNTIATDFSPSKLLDQIRLSSIDLMAESLTEAGINANIIAPVKSMVQKSITTGAQYTDLLNNVSNSIQGDKNNAGSLERYTRQITTDGLNQYSAQYMDTVASHLGFEWYMYVGSNLTTTRPFCQYLTLQKYIHSAEIPDILAGHVDDRTIPINPKTGVWAGGVPGTDEDNFPIYRGGYNCGHQLIPVSEIVVPKIVRTETYDKYGIEYDAKGIRKAA